MIDLIKKIFKKHKEVISYLFFGVLTTAVDFVSYYLLTRIFHLDPTLSNVLAQLIAIIFAYVTNKLYVFEDKTNNLLELAVQFCKFFSCRLVTLVINTLMFKIMLSMSIHDMVTKVIVSVVVIILNYVFSKLLVFTKKGKSK